MTTITLMTNDQALSVVTKPLVASGDYNLVKVKVEFDSTWERYEVRSAVFRTMKGAEAEVLLTDDECTVPHEVLAEPGTLFIAMRGVTLSGDIIKTTEEVKYKVVQGAKDIASTTAPSHDMYAQYMAAIAAGLAPHITAMNEEVEEAKALVDAKVDGRLAELDALAGSYIRMKTGSYIGAGACGADNPNTLTFDFEPKMVIVYKDSYTPGYSPQDEVGEYSKNKQEFFYGAHSFGVRDNSSHGATTAYTMSGNTLTWYTKYNNATESNMIGYGYAFQMNSAGVTYYYIAIGV